MKSYKLSNHWNADNIKDVKNREDLVSITFPSTKFIIFQSTIVSSVLLENASKYNIASNSIQYVNNNGECWSNESLKNNYKSFIGAYACIDHPDDPASNNVGVILDAILRKRWIDKDNGKYVYYCDLLVAIDNDSLDGKLSKMIAAGDIRYMSMGCNVKLSYCSKCGFQVDYTKSSGYSYGECDHLKFSKGKKFIDSQGKERIVAELLGDNKGTVDFIEASVLTDPPAFAGAALARIYPISTDSKEIEITLPKECLEKGAVKKYLL